MSFEQHPYTGAQQDQYDFLSQHTSPTPGWITGEGSTEDASDPVQLNFRHGHSQGNAIDIKYNILFQELKEAHGGENNIPQEEKFTIILQYLIEKVILGDDNDTELTELGRSQARDANQALKTSMESSGKNISQISISPYRRTLETATGILDGIVEIDFEELLENGQGIRRGNTIIQIDKRLEEKKSGIKGGYYHGWARGFLKKEAPLSILLSKSLRDKNHKESFLIWLKNEGGHYFNVCDNPGDMQNKVIQVLLTGTNPESSRVVTERIREQITETLQRSAQDELSITITHAGVIKHVVTSITDPGNTRGIYQFLTREYAPENLSLTITGYDPESGLYLAGYNLRPKE